MIKQSTQKLSLVKNASLEKLNDQFIINHYGTMIYNYNPANKTSWMLLDCSPTSNRQIRMANDFFKPKKTIEEINDPRWQFKGARN